MAAPSAKQLDYIASLMGIRDNAYHSMAYAEIGKDMRMSSSAAAKRATAKDASETIDRLKQKSNPSRRSGSMKYLVHVPDSDYHTTHASLAKARSVAQQKANRNGREYEISSVSGKNGEWQFVQSVRPAAPNPSRRSVSLNNFSGTITRNSNGTVTVKGRGKVAKKRAK